ncbi:phospholipid-transporting ATPase ID isoform X2 [Lingula anatina]|uniref:Phospholipid-transporting ATPase n=1 Tax=Lingula anatina TaxID=7574 RepID=A0A1S3IF50_LINAN|nr:phospholipid-transporting ATPase ID isoform X2 [Lingula anatina]XP_013396895.1 phospholipid-transporting ATPase ID isoform X2 [Lingula anatina]|eukprot:XP_013396894.1 phospholipid-transporting ATPase ID isoform X2 [Lingula anatina]
MKMKPCWKKEKPIELERKIKSNDSAYNESFNYANNYICTSKYTWYTFLPKNLFEQFQRIANSYFLGLLILQLIPPISSLTPVTTIVPLAVVLTITALKDAIDDIQRHRSDNRVNNRLSSVLRNGQLVEERWHKVEVGDIIKMENNQFVAADLLLLSTSEPNSLCYIETAELDGETNLKVRQALPETAEMGNDIGELSKFDGELTCEAPNNRLNKYEGTLKWKGEAYSVDNDKILLRGCVLRNTMWCYGLVVFAGQDTKLMMNCGESMFKRTNIDRLMNVLIIRIVIALCCLCLICTVAFGIWESTTGFDFQLYLPWEDYIPGTSLGTTSGTKEAGATVLALMVFFSYVIILNTVVPISLYVSVEVIRFVNSWWINWDRKMHHPQSDTPARARTTTLNEELGQIEYIFSDKTGTLTQNIMTFNKCSINGKMYGDPYDPDGNPMEICDRTKVDFSGNHMYEESFEFHDVRLLKAVQNKDPHADEFFRVLALCHTVMSEEKDGKLEYQAQSPDEAALVSAARNFGFVFKTRTPTTITIEVNGVEEIYELLCILDFNNVRKRMSVIVKKDDKIMLMCKGADTTVYAHLDKNCGDIKELTTSHLNEFAHIGLRTLCLATKEIDSNYYNEWKKKHHRASTSMVNRDEMLDEVFEEIEQNLTLIGATAIEDKLQDGVPQTIANLALADIKIWVLTGDKQETAINIGYSCKLLTEEMEEVFVVDGESKEQVAKQLQNAKDMMSGHSSVEVVSYAGTATPMQNGNSTEEFGGYALVINGHSLVFALHKDMEQLLLETGCLCKAVICCRVTPLQKALVVDLVKVNKKSITLAIGDGANDVSMIKTAHIGVGISGQEGMQAVLASDFSLAQFRYLERLLLCHGRWSYVRMCIFLRYFFYKNFTFTFCHFWFAFFCGFSAQTLYDPFFISLYNLCYTSMPVLVIGIFEQDVNDIYSIKYPKLYAPGLSNLLFNKKVFLHSVFEGVVSSLLLFFIPYGAFNMGVDPTGHDVADFHTYGVTVASILIPVVTFRLAIDTQFWSVFNPIMTFGSIIFYFCSIFFLYSDIFGNNWLITTTYTGAARHTMATANFWFSLVLGNVVLLLPVVAYRFYKQDTAPTLTDRVRLRTKLSKSKSKSRDLGLKLSRASFNRSSKHGSIRSGYAFAHQEGFGQLITSGSIMRANRPLDGATPIRQNSAGNGTKTKLSDGNLVMNSSPKNNIPSSSENNVELVGYTVRS